MHGGVLPLFVKFSRRSEKIKFIRAHLNPFRTAVSC